MDSGSVAPSETLVGHREHLQRLVAAWGLLADLCFSDLLLAVANDGGPAGEAFEIIGQVRPTTAQTLYPDDLVGQRIERSERPQLGEVLEQGTVIEAQHRSLGRLDTVIACRVTYLPVRHAGVIIAVLTREQALDAARRPGRLERTYLSVFEEFAAMVGTGRFPFPDGAVEAEEAPRVGDGAMVVDRLGMVVFASPNAVSALHRGGVMAKVEGKSFDATGLDRSVVDTAMSSGLPEVREVEIGKVILVLRAIPFDAVPGDATLGGGALILLRDVTDLRRRDRLLVSKDASIREVHHRVKNNLQTISALLRIQGRRLGSPEAKSAIDESVRRIRSIALVHEILSREVTPEAVPFDQIARPLLRMVEEGLQSPERPVRITLEGNAGLLSDAVATPLAVVLTELLQNSIEHGFPDSSYREEEGHVVVMMDNDGAELRVVVRDNGVGLPAGFTARADTLGLSIVRTLVTGELGGAIAFRSDRGAVVELRIPLHG